MDNKNQEFNGNGWTQYQKLVLAELERHEDKQEKLQRNLLELQIVMTRLEIQLAQIHNSISTLSSENKTLDKARETHNIDLKAIQWKVTAFSTGAAGLLTILIQILTKMFIK